jgi:hypothetical protein
VDINRGVDLLHADIDSFILQVTDASSTGTFIAELNNGHNPGGNPGTDKGDGSVQGRIWVTVDSEL